MIEAVAEGLRHLEARPSATAKLVALHEVVALNPTCLTLRLNKKPRRHQICAGPPPIGKENSDA